MEGFHLEQFWFSLLRREDIRELWHPELEVIFLLQGGGRVLFSDLKTAYELQEKDIFVVNSFEVQEFELEPDSIALSFMVSTDFISHVAPELFPLSGDLLYRLPGTSAVFQRCPYAGGAGESEPDCRKKWIPQC